MAFSVKHFENILSCSRKANQVMIYVLTGVSGVGKTTIGILLSKKLNLPFYDADDYHPSTNVEKMKNGISLQDEDRKGWLESLSKKIKEWDQGLGAILACSALKETYRKKLQSIPEDRICWIFLHSEYEIIFARMEARENHYFNPDLLQSQYDTLEIPADGIHINVNKTVDQIIREILDHLEDLNLK